VSEKHDTATGKKLFIDMITNVNELSNVLVENISEDTSMYFGGDSINGNAEELRAFYKQEYSHLDKENREEIVQAALLISRLTQRINFAFFARNDWRDQVQERWLLTHTAYSGAAFVFLRFMNLRFLIICSGTKAMLLFGLGGSKI
jgi:hypothetical protein